MTGSTSPGGTDPVPRALLYRGAEADVLLGKWQGLDAVFKIRKPLTYRLKALDDSIRRQRTLREADMIRAAKTAGAESPFMFAVDVPLATIVMEYVRGERLRDLVGGMGKPEAREAFKKFGREVGKLHLAGIMHGDLTTANVVMRRGRPVLIDFGLATRSTRLEDHAVDLRLIKETLAGAHPSLAPEALASFNGGYSGTVGPARSREVLKQLQSIERRGRYARVT